MWSWHIRVTWLKRQWEFVSHETGANGVEDIKYCWGHSYWQMNLCSTPVGQASAGTLSSRSRLDTETRVDVIVTLSVHSQQMDTTVRRLEDMIKL